MKFNILSPEEFKSINEKTENQTYDYGCLMGYFDVQPESLYKQYFDIDEDDLYDNEENEYGKEIEPHATLLYGLHDDSIEEQEVIKLMNMIKMPIVEFKSITLFENEKYDVLKWDLDKEQLEIINKIVDNLFENTQSFPDYHPHCTIAYLKPGEGKKYIREDIEGPKQQITKWVYSQANGRKIAIYPDGHIQVLREAGEEDEVKEAMKYNGYSINYKKSEKFDNMYNFSIFKDNIYKMGIKSTISYDEGIEACKNYINNG